MDKRLKKVAIVSAAFALVVFGLAGFFIWRNVAYVDTFHARVMGESTVMTMPVSGRLLQCDVQPGDAVAEGEEIAVIEAHVTGTEPGRVALPLRAPVSGIVVQRTTDPTETIAAGQSFVTILNPDSLWVEANIHESRIGRVKVGQSVQVRVRALKISFPGHVEQVGRVANIALAPDGGRSTLSQPANAEVPVRIALDTAGYRLAPGMSVEVRIRIDPRAW
jgi:multidrug resistance efflux pump